MKNRKLLIILIIVGFILLIPLIAMQFSGNVVWSGFDFLVAGILLNCTGLTIEFAFRKIYSKKKRLIACVIILAALLLVWTELAVGIFGTPLAGS